ncbi:MAG: SulP family inorganic anion transporter [Elusimicrobia bacterium]|nr:SulP family inorganic anion transporter [Elusimicrobiota bacterium]
MQPGPTSPSTPANPFQRERRPAGLRRWIPGWQTLRAYPLPWLVDDASAGLALTAVLVPVGMGYAEASGLPAINGLYATIAPLVAYAVFGPSRILVMGPDSSLAAIIAATVVPLAAGDPGRSVALAGTLALLSGALCVLAGAARAGFLADLLSKPVRLGYLNGIALTVLIGQVPKLLGFSAAGDNVVQKAASLAKGVADGRTNWTALAIGGACLAVILALKRRLPRVPGALVAVVGALAVTGLFDLSATAGVAVLGPLPQGLPAFRPPLLSLDVIRLLLPGAAAIALVSFADTTVLSRTFALRCGQDVDQDQELVALGAANVAAGLFQGFSVSSSSSRTPVAESAGARTQVTGLVGALGIALLLIGAPGLLRNLPGAALGAVVISAVLSLIDLDGLLRLYRLRRSEFVFAVACFLGVALVGVIQGIFIAITLALLAFIWRAWRPYDAVLGRVDGLKGYHDIARHPEAKRIPGLVLFRWDAPLFFANADVFHRHVLQAVAEAATPTRWVVVAAEPVTDVDITAADALSALDDDLQREGIELCFAEMKGPVKDLLKRYGLFSKLGDDLFFRTVGQAVDAYLKAHPVEWLDWEDR